MTKRRDASNHRSMEKALPAGAIGFLTSRPDMRRYALYFPNGTLSNTFAFDDTPAQIAARCHVRLVPIAQIKGCNAWAAFRAEV